MYKCYSKGTYDFLFTHKVHLNESWKIQQISWEPRENETNKVFVYDKQNTCDRRNHAGKKLCGKILTIHCVALIELDHHYHWNECRTVCSCSFWAIGMTNMSPVVIGSVLFRIRWANGWIHFLYCKSVQNQWFWQTTAWTTWRKIFINFLNDFLPTIRPAVQCVSVRIWRIWADSVSLTQWTWKMRCIFIVGIGSINSIVHETTHVRNGKYFVHVVEERMCCVGLTAIFAVHNNAGIISYPIQHKHSAYFISFERVQNEWNELHTREWCFMRFYRDFCSYVLMWDACGRETTVMLAESLPFTMHIRSHRPFYVKTWKLLQL